jgi:hypothetical protein
MQALANAQTHTIPPSNRGILICRNASGAQAVTLTITVPGTQYGQARPDVVHTIPISTERWVIGGFVADLANPATGLIDLVITGTGTLSAEAYEV